MLIWEFEVPIILLLHRIEILVLLLKPIIFSTVLNGVLQTEIITNPNYKLQAFFVHLESSTFFSSFADIFISPPFFYLFLSIFHHALLEGFSRDSPQLHRQCHLDGSPVRKTDSLEHRLTGPAPNTLVLAWCYFLFFPKHNIDIYPVETRNRAEIIGVFTHICMYIHGVSFCKCKIDVFSSLLTGQFKIGRVYVGHKT